MRTADTADTVQTDVVIIGAGPTGLSLACQLIRYGIDFVIVEKNSGLTPFSKALAVHARTLEIYEQMDLATPAVAQGMIAKSVRIVEGGKVRGEVDLSHAGDGMSPYPFVLNLEQSKNEALLYEYIKSHGKDVIWKTEMTELAQTYTGVTARVRNADKREYEIEAKYLVGCDGPHSPVRHALGLTFEGSTFERLFYVADVRLDWEFPHNAMHVCLVPNSVVAFFPMKGDNRYRIVGAFPDGMKTDPDQIPFEQIEQHVRRETEIPLHITQVNWFSTYKVHSRHVDRFSEGRCFLAGDAAHIHTPAGGQGMNTGIQDAYNLAWKLASVLKAQANGRILDTYNQERLENAKRLLQTTDRLFSAASGSDWLLNFIRTTIFPVLAKYVIGSEIVRSRFFPMISQIGIHYRDSELSEHTGENGFSVVAGDRLPYCQTEGKSLYDLLRAPRFHLLHFVPDGSGEGGADVYETETADVEREFGTLLDQHSVPLTPQISEKFGTDGPFSVLVRPDSHIALFCRKHVRKAVQAYVSEHLGEMEIRPGRRDRRGSVLHPITRNLLLTTLEGTPLVIAGLIADLGPDDPRWEIRSSPDRFTIREITAHLADMETVWGERIARMLEKENPDLPNADEDQMAVDNSYDTSIPDENLKRFRQERASLIGTLRTLSEREWARTGLIRAFLPMTVERLAIHITGHDGYHTAQIADYLFSDLVEPNA